MKGREKKSQKHPKIIENLTQNIIEVHCTNGLRGNNILPTCFLVFFVIYIYGLTYYLVDCPYYAPVS